MVFSEKFDSKPKFIIKIKQKKFFWAKKTAECNSFIIIKKKIL